MYKLASTHVNTIVGYRLKSVTESDSQHNTVQALCIILPVREKKYRDFTVHLTAQQCATAEEALLLKALREANMIIHDLFQL